MELKTEALVTGGEGPGYPLPRRSVLGGAVIPGRIKVRPEDFLVEELPLYDPVGKGEHLYLGVRKQGLPHTELVRVLKQHFRVKEHAIGFAGMKDKVAVTNQQVSIHLPGSDPESLDIRDERVEVLWAARHLNKLRRGHLVGNRFSIRIRETDPLKAPLVMTKLKELVRLGVPNYYGFQRFGYRCNTHLLGRYVIRGEWDKAVAELIGSTGSTFPDRQRKARELVDEGRFSESLRYWTRNEHAEVAALRTLAKGKSPEDAIRSINKYTVSFWVSAFQSSVFNGALDARIDEGALDQVNVGDVAMRHDSRRQFVVHDEIHADPTLAESVRNLEVSASGPIWGSHMLEPFGHTRECELGLLEERGVSRELIETSPLVPRGTRRPLRIAVANIEVDSGVDENGGYIRTAFDLPRGSYATVLLRELIEGIDPD